MHSRGGRGLDFTGMRLRRLSLKQLHIISQKVHTNTPHKYLNVTARWGGDSRKPSISAGIAKDPVKVSALILLERTEIFFFICFPRKPISSVCGENSWHYAVDCCENHSFGSYQGHYWVRESPPPIRNLDANIGGTGLVLKGHFKSI